MSFVLRYLLIFLSIKIFGVLHVISRMQEDVFPTATDLHNLAVSSIILRGPGIYHPLITYCSIQSEPLVHVERICPTISLNFNTLHYLCLGQGNCNSHKSNHWCLKIPPWFMLQLVFVFFNVEIIRGFTLTFVAICSDTSYPFGFTSRIKMTPLDILKSLFTTLINQDKKMAFILVY